VIYVGVVGNVFTLASGGRFSEQEAHNNPAHKRIIEHSPIKVKDFDEPFQYKPLFLKSEVDDYLFRLNRYAGRRVDVIKTSGTEEGEMAVGYLVTENKPLLVYTQVSNTGTEQTSKWRERLGLTHTQLTNNDDTFTFDYITAGLQAAHAITSSYEAPCYGSELLRWRVFALWSEFDASEVGRADERFLGEEYTGGLELIRNVFQHDDLFVDLFAGARWRRITVDNQTVLLKGEDDFFLPRGGIRLQKSTDVSSTFASIAVEGNMSGVADTEASEIEKFGRLDADASWAVVQWDVSHSFFIEPIISGDWSGLQNATLAHEIAFSARGQYANGYRLVPQAQEVAGGFYTVRGYPEAAAAGDSAEIGTFEYRLHLPRTFKPERQPRKVMGHDFRFAPQVPGGRPDWDLIVKAFIDAGHTANTRRLSIEDDHTLLGTGAGIELQLKRNINVRCDWALALRPLESAEVRSGDSLWHVCATFMW